MVKRSTSIFLILFALVLANCNDSTSPAGTETSYPLPTTTHEEPSPTRKPQPSDTPMPPTLTPFTSDIPPGPAIAHFSPGQEITITTIHMFEPSTGWAIGGAEDHILITHDGGASWRDVTPPEPAPTGNETQKTALGVFLNPSTAWVTYYPEFPAWSNPTAIWRTIDAGQTWSASTLPPDEILFGTHGPLWMHFSDAGHGWLMLMLDAGMSHVYVTLYRTTDGGVNWEKTIDPYNPDSGNLHICCQTGADFYNAKPGLVTFSRGPNESVFIDWTEDGGLSWRSQQLPPPAGMSDTADFNGLVCETASPILFSPQSAMLTLKCTIEPGTKQQTINYLYTTEDGGLTWETSPFPGGELLFIERSTGWALGRDIFQTLDGGLTWSKIKRVSWDGQFSFVDSQHGWAVARADEEIALVKTEDSGRTWIELEPIVGP
jgi:photosystem II stability/assembly factor-like uncharacterized protein